MSRAVSIIRQEHLNYRALLQCLDQLAAEASESRQSPDVGLFHDIVDYIDSFLHRYHHPKEDDHLFRALLQRHPGCRTLVRHLQDEHGKGDDLLRALKEALSTCESGVEPDWIRFADAAGRYREHQERHMRAEETEALPLAEEYLKDEDWRDIDAAFCAHDDPLFGDAPSESYRRLYAKILDLAPAPFGYGAKGRR